MYSVDDPERVCFKRLIRSLEWYCPQAEAEDIVEAQLKCQEGQVIVQKSPCVGPDYLAESEYVVHSNSDIAQAWCELGMYLLTDGYTVSHMGEVYVDPTSLHYTTEGKPDGYVRVLFPVWEGEPPDVYVKKVPQDD